MSEPLEDYTQLIRSQIPILGAMGLRVVRLSPGTAAVEAPQEPNLNHVGIFYAGSLFSLAEVLGGLLPLITWDMTGYAPVVAGLDIRFRRPAVGTIRAAAELSADEVARVRAAMADGESKIRFVLETTLTDGDGTVVATTTGQYVLIAISR
jgi:thioesterase domain-containing protein